MYLLHSNHRENTATWRLESARAHALVSAYNFQLRASDIGMLDDWLNLQADDNLERTVESVKEAGLRPLSSCTYHMYRFYVLCLFDVIDHSTSVKSVM